jgi:hypothetical protein
MALSLLLTNRRRGVPEVLSMGILLHTAYKRAVSHSSPLAPLAETKAAL